MKTLKQIFRTSLLLRGVAAAALLLTASVQTSQAGSANPSGSTGSFTWDLLSTGAGQRGMAFITFTSDGAFHGYQLLSATPPASASGTNSGTSGRGGGSTGRSSGSTVRNGGGTNQIAESFYGFGPINGTWTISSKGQIVGALNQNVQVTSVVTNFLASTNIVTLVNSQTSETTNVTVVFVTGQASVNVGVNWPNPPPGFTQNYTIANTQFTTAVGSTKVSDTISFTGKAVLDTSLTLVCSTGAGHIIFHGVPAQTGADLSGDWIGIQRENGNQVNEFFTLTSFQAGNPFPLDFPDISEFQNLYFTTNGLSGSSAYVGVAMLSQQKTIGFTFKDENSKLRSVMGKLKPTKFGPTANTKGIDEPFTLVNFTATLQ